MENTNDSAHGRSGSQVAKFIERDTDYRFRALVDAVRDYAIVMLDENGDVAIWNAGAEHLTGYSASEIVGRPLSLLHDANDINMQDILSESRTKGRAEFEGWRYRKDGTRFWNHSVVSIVSENDSFIGYSEIARDLTERRANEQALIDMSMNLERLVRERTADLEAANKELEAFSYSVSHDLRAPLRSIDGFAKVLIEDFGQKLDADMLNNLEIISRNAVKMGVLIDDLLTFSKLNRVPLVTMEVSLQRLAQAVFQELRSEFPDDRKVNLRILDMPSACVDKAMMRQVYHNLLSNALKFSLPKPVAEIEVGSFVEDRNNVFYVSDNGVGFDMRYAHKLFGPFQRLHRSKDFSGTGIGLALVQRIIHRHGGTVWIKGEVDKGTTIYFTIPDVREDSGE